ncbi:MAG: DUF1461 domain-containing protein [Gracilibacteraceae bacterium]|nr:DUF1461 domain-containing protein [Gracilibacteraceae bacterium]
MNRGLQSGAASLAGVLAGLLLIGLLLIAAVVWQAADMSFYAAEYAKYGNAAALAMSEADLLVVTGELLAYLRGEAPDMNIQAAIAGRRQEMFNEREKAHMIDVRLLYRRMLQAGGAGAALCLAGGIFSLRRCGWRGAARAWGRGYLKALALAAVAALALTALITRDFTAFWTNFHGVFFTNDLWLLDPATDRMIVMFPEGFFFDLVGAVLGLWAAGAGGAALLAGAIVFWPGKSEAENRRLNYY